MSEEGVFVDPKRGERVGMPEVVLAAGKSDRELVSAVKGILEYHPVLVTKASLEQMDLLERELDGQREIADRNVGLMSFGGTWDTGVGRCAVISAGSADRSVAEEAALSLEYLGIEPVRAYDRGVAGIHRLDSILSTLRENEDMGVIVVAGMEAALPSVVAGSLKQPVFAVPTSVGYGTCFEGLSALLGMLNSCVPGIVVVNIDNGFGAAAAIYRSMKTWRGC